jgi:hypothetical protein
MEYILLNLSDLIWSFRGHLGDNKNIVVEDTKLVKEVKHEMPQLEHGQDRKQVPQVNIKHTSYIPAELKCSVQSCIDIWMIQPYHWHLGF